MFSSYICIIIYIYIYRVRGMKNERPACICQPAVRQTGDPLLVRLARAGKYNNTLLVIVRGLPGMFKRGSWGLPLGAAASSPAASPAQPSPTQPCPSFPRLPSPTPKHEHLLASSVEGKCNKQDPLCQSFVRSMAYERSWYGCW